MKLSVADSLLSLVFPQDCHICSNPVAARRDGIACDDCWDSSRIFSVDDQLCIKCGFPLNAQTGTAAAKCGDCSEHLYTKAFACGVYEAAIAASILELKRVPIIPGRLENEIRPAFDRASVGDPTVLIPVPLSKKRRAERGFNQAEIIATAVSRRTGLPIDAYSLKRVIHTRMHRAGMDKRARESTVQNAFKVERPKVIQGQKVVLVDDVFTSGATASSCARVLLANGAERVDIFTLARAPRHQG
ncbi:MAG: ComF family protein [Pyrinomonadaceae bacterium]